MSEQRTRRQVLAGMAAGASSFLFSGSICSAEIFGQAPGVPSVGNTHLLTLAAVNPGTLLGIVQQGKQGAAAEIGILPQPWPETLPAEDTVS